MLCELCGVREANQRHHKIFRSKVKALEHCDRNLAIYVMNVIIKYTIIKAEIWILN